eukprot:11215829-Lingulodinium_polyedra.AAC.1
MDASTNRCGADAQTLSTTRGIRGTAAMVTLAHQTVALKYRTQLLAQDLRALRGNSQWDA